MIKKFIIKKFIIRMTTGLLVLSILAFFYFMLPPIALSMLFGSILLFILFFEWGHLGSFLLAPIYPIFPFLLLIAINQNPSERFLVMLIFSITWSFDTGAYIIGKLFGRIKITPKISPYKTVEGFVGGIITSVFINYFIFGLLQLNQDPVIFIPLITLLCLTAFIGDIFVSYLKRKAKLKDSGSLLPGHGGLLDRFDGIMTVTLLIYVIKTLIHL